ncbi:hypothetical protein M3223_21725 [Paenibacillus pasadenensis]|uniref:hypothetical protein n=1 Tax=Paenibacillus pasadenensis TaxID=217090 RepID=UPI00203FE4CC|nr:hypothetical protein [Paenibacillus pasadenensis]MCM3749959.1 hypothetical protein [Paenibacillus pasadenensis]
MKKLLIFISLLSLIANAIFIFKLLPNKNDEKSILSYTVMISRINDAHNVVTNLIHNYSNNANVDLSLFHAYLYLEEADINYRQILPQLQEKKIIYEKFSSLFYDSKRYLLSTVGDKLNVNGSLDLEKLKDVERNLNAILKSLPIKVEKETNLNSLKEEFRTIR